MLIGGRRQDAERTSARIQRAWAAWTLRLLGVRVESVGGPSGPSLIVANHLSWLDIFVLASQVDCRFVAKSEIARWPGVGLLARTVGTVFVDRGRRSDAARVAARMGDLLESDVSVVQFPEGAVMEGLVIGRFHPALFEPAARAALPCHPAALTYDTPQCGLGTRFSVGWWGGVGLVPHAFRLVRCGEVVARCAWSPTPHADVDRKVLATIAQRSVEEAFEPLTSGPIPPGDPRSEAISLGR